MTWRGRAGVTLEAFLTARVDEDEGYLNSNRRHLWTGRPLREVAAKRAILEMHGETHECPSEYNNCGWFEFENGAICPTLRHVAAVYRDHPDYDPAWGISTGR